MKDPIASKPSPSKLRFLKCRQALPLALLGLLVVPLSTTQAAEITEDNFVEYVANATTQADHEALAKFFRVQAAEQGKKIRIHEEMRNRYRQTDIGGQRVDEFYLLMDIHCRDLIRSHRAVREAYQELAESHERTARDLAAGQ